MLKVERIYNVTLLSEGAAQGLLYSIYHRACRASDGVDCIRCVRACVCRKWISAPSSILACADFF